MGYKRKIYTLAAARIAESRNKAENEANTALLNFYKACPRAEEIDRFRTGESTRIARAVLSGGDTKALIAKLREKSLALQEEYNSLVRENGLTPEDLQPKYSCKQCGDTGYIDGKMCTCLIKMQKQIAFEELNMQVPLAKSTFENFSLSYYSDQRAKDQAKRILEMCQGYVNKFSVSSPNLLFLGATGLGKTHLSLAIANKVIEKGFSVIYASTQSLSVNFEQERFSYDRENNTNSYLLECDLLILDDLGAEFPSSYAEASLYDVINSRILSGKPIIISSNMSLKEMEKRYSPRLVSRLFGNFSSFGFIGLDMRVENKKNKLGAPQG